jgi:hypothetical protein
MRLRLDDGLAFRRDRRDRGRATTKEGVAMRLQLALLVSSACASSVPVGDSESTSSGETTSTTSTSSSDSSSSTSSGTPDPGGYEVDSGAEGCAFACPDPPSNGGGGGGGGLGCSTWAQNCPADQKCVPSYDWTYTICVPLAPDPKDVGDACLVDESSADDCGFAMMCLVDTCVALCAGSPTSSACDDPSTTCVITNSGVLPLCLRTCDPVEQGCDDGDACYPVNDEFVCIFDAGGDMGAYGEPCEFLNVCDPGLVCADTDAVPDCQGSIGCCSMVCDLDDDDPDASCPDVASGQRCVAWYEPGTAPPNLGHVGVCR